jgi:hypothetical protein
MKNDEIHGALVGFPMKNDEIAGNSIWISTRNTGGKCDFMCLNGT